MRNSIIVCSFIFSLFSFTSVFAQNMDERLLVKYNKAEIETMMKSQPAEYQFLINALDKGMFISEIPFEKNENISFDGTLNIDPYGSHNFLTIGKEIKDRYQYFKISGTTMMVVILPRIYLDSELQKQIK